MRELCLSEHYTDEEFISHCSGELAMGNSVFVQLSRAFPVELVCSGLRRLEWRASHHRLHSLRHFLSPTLTEIEIFTTPSGDSFQSPSPAIPVLPGSYLRSLQLTFQPADDEAFGTLASATILQCGAFLERLETSAQLSEAAVSHIVGLPHLHTLRIGSGPPPDPAGGPTPYFFTSLETLTLESGVGHRWLALLEAAQGSSSTDGNSGTPEAGMKTTLTNLRCLGRTTVDPTFTSSLCIFRNLTHVFADGSCSKKDGCTFLLTDDVLAKLADALPDLKSLQLGSPCSANRCHTTALSLFILSTRCLKLKTLEIHFNTTKISHLLDRLFKEPQYERMRSLPRCPLRYLNVADTPISTHDVGSVAIRFSGIFHGLQGFRSRHINWTEASRKVRLLFNFRMDIAPGTCIVSKTSGISSYTLPEDNG